MGRNKERKGKENKRALVTVLSFPFEDLHCFRDKLAVFQSGAYHWTVHLYRGKVYNEEYAVLDIFCHSSLANWSYEAEGEVQMSNKFACLLNHNFESKRNCISCPTLIMWKDLENPANGFCVDGVVDVDIRLTKVPRKVIKNAAAFVKDYPGIKNLEIVVGKSKFRVNQQLLAYTSAFFDEEYLEGKFKDNEPYILRNIAPMNFRLYLDLVYLPKQYFSAYYAKDMLEIANRFRNTEILATCQNVILEDLKENKLSHKDKAKLAETYDFDTVEALFHNSDGLPRKRRPRFMTEEHPGLDLKNMALKDLMDKAILPHLADCPYRKRDSDEEEEEIDFSQPSTSGLIY